MARAERAVCGVEWDGEQQGTGFLVDDATVLTNRHVVAPFIGKVQNRLSVRFGFAEAAGGGIQNGTTFAAASPWLGRNRPHDPADEDGTADTAPAPANLDYALIALEHRPDDIQPIALLEDAPVPRMGADVIIIQHPNRRPKETAFGCVSGLPHEASRMRYDANTINGASGSPVLNNEGVLVGLHHAGDPNFSRMAQYNQGIPARLIAADIAASRAAG